MVFRVVGDACEQVGGGKENKRTEDRTAHTKYDSVINYSYFYLFIYFFIYFLFYFKISRWPQEVKSSRQAQKSLAATLVFIIKLLLHKGLMPGHTKGLMGPRKK